MRFSWTPSGHNYPGGPHDRSPSHPALKTDFEADTDRDGMNAIIAENVVLQDEWHGLYKESWTGVIVPDSFAHPAKFSRALIRKIYDHVIEEGWAEKGSRVIDPFGGVALGGLDAMRHGLHFIGVELEEKFVKLGNQNIALWNERYSRMPNWGTAQLLQGDSRQLSSILDNAELLVSSPPYAKTDLDGRRPNMIPNLQKKLAAGQLTGRESVRLAKQGKLSPHEMSNLADYGSSEGQLGAMREGSLDMAISSPPYINSVNSGESGIDWDKAKRPERWTGNRNRNGCQAAASHEMKYGATDGQLGAMPAGELCVTSPPYNPPMSQDHNGSRGGQRGTTPSEKGAFVKYGNTEGQLEGMSMEGFDIAIASPPYSTGDSAGPESLARRKDGSAKAMLRSQGWGEGGQVSDGNLATLKNDGFECAISSPPFESSTQVNNAPGDMTEGPARWEGGTDSAARVKQDYADYSLENMGNKRGETFWSASRIILEQLYQVLAPGAHAIFVVKSFVRNKQIVDFPGQWARLCEAVGFNLLHDHHALLIEKKAVQPMAHGVTPEGDTWRIVQDKDHSVARKSFFRRLAESKGSPRIDYENVLCFEKPL